MAAPNSNLPVPSSRPGGLVPIVPRPDGTADVSPRATDREVDITTPSELEAYVHGSLTGTSSGAIVNAATAMRVGTVFACTRILSQTYGMLPLRLRRQTGRMVEDAVDHPLYRLLRRQPNKWQTAYEFRQMLMSHLCLRGNGYALIVRGVGGRVIAMIPLHPDRVEPKQQDDLSITYTWRRKTGERIVFPQEDILHLRGLTQDGVVGLSPIGAAREAIGLSMQAEKQGAHWFKGGTNPGGVLTYPRKLQEDQLTRLRKDITEMYVGADNVGKTMILEDGMQWAKVGMTADEVQFIEGRKFQRSEIAMYFGIPPHMLGDVEKNTSWGSGIESQGIGFVTYTMLPHLEAGQQAFDRDLLTAKEKETLFTHFDISALLRGDFKTRQEGLQIQRRNGVLNGRRMAGHRRIESAQRCRRNRVHRRTEHAHQ